MFNLAFDNHYAKLVHEELIRQAEMQRLADLARKPRRSMRRAIAEALMALADRIAGTPDGAVVQPRWRYTQ